ncbi:hypothetical protein HII28_01465 [Planctomonas sp. JC2975]|uniref:hypothetical protein n=1 Tax=Planctomonas sp. JC2975 TaxID=2729626 RepID=UPI00147370D7|nr:hypothetical protein [Planctomonas sp. JC2975]NNC10556.1 hypothetical protein [Planctomonas sp. JC2975]
MTARPPKGELDKRIAGAVFVVFWLVAIAAWIVAGVALGNTGAWQPFVVDVGIVIASVGFAAPFLSTVKGFGLALLFGLIAVVGFAIGDFGHIVPLVYFLRIIVPFFAIVIAPTFKLANGVKVFA